METRYSSSADLGRIQGYALGIGLFALIAWLAIAVATGGGITTFFRTYLVAFIFWTGIALGCLGFLMVQYLGGATWGLVIRRLLESASHTLWLMLALFLPIAIFGLRSLYEWADKDKVTNEALKKLIEHKSAYLNPTFFTVRGLIYFAIWLSLVYFLRKWSHELDETGDPLFIQRAQNLSGPGFVFYGLACTFAAIDWIMSLDAEWFSTIFGLLNIAGQGVSAMAFIILVSVFLVQHEPMSHIYQPKHFHDYGKLMLALVMIWAYFSFSQLLIIWSGNLPEEIPWYLERFQGIWRIIGMGLLVLYFALPFLLLLSRDLKRNARRLRLVAWLILVMRMFELLWLIVPEFDHGHQGHPSTYLIYPIAVIGLGGIWLGWFFWQLQQRSLIPLNDPLLQEALAAGEHH